MDDDVLRCFEELPQIDEIEDVKLKKHRVNLDMWGKLSSKAHKKNCKINKFLKSFRLSILKLIMETLKVELIDTMVYGGTALAVWRDNGKIIPHDHDIDLAILEKDFLNAYKSLNKRTEIYATAKCPFSGKIWFNEDETDQILYDHIGVKRMKVYFNKTYIRAMAVSNKKFQKLLDRYDRNKLCIDIFCLQKQASENYYLVTWNLPEVYDNSKKPFPEEVLFPLKEYVLENIIVKGPQNIQKYLEIEYGYLEKDARFDDKTQLYVKLTEEEFRLLPPEIRNYMNS